MSALFTSASSQYLINSAPPVVTGFTMGLWCSPLVVATTKNIWGLGDPANINHGFRLQATATQFQIAAQAGGVASSLNLAVVPVVGKWYFCLMRISTGGTSWRLDVMATDGAVITNSSAVTRNAICNTCYLGCLGGSTISNFYDGHIAEYWMTNTDIAADGAFIQPPLIRHLARSGPFSVPHIAQAVVDYRSFRNGVAEEQDGAPDYFYGPKGRQNWVNTNGVIRGRNPPINEGIYRRPGDFIRPGIV